MKFKYMVVDDEPLARKLIESHATKVEILELSGSYGNAIEAANALRKHKVDVLFLDIQMPELNGLDFIKTLRQPPAIILTTAYREYAADAFDLDVLDYLVKPVSFERFLKAIDKFAASGSKANEVSFTPEQDFTIHIRSNRKTFPVSLQEILYIESLDSYVKVYLKDKVLITHENISTLEQRLPTAGFVRIHRSFILNKKHITSYTSESVFLGATELPFGRAFKQSALTNLDATT